MTQFIMRKGPGNFKMIAAEGVRKFIEEGSTLDFFMIKEGPRSITLKKVTQGKAKTKKIAVTTIMVDGVEL